MNTALIVAGCLIVGALIGIVGLALLFKYGLRLPRL